VYSHTFILTHKADIRLLRDRPVKAQEVDTSEASAGEDYSFDVESVKKKRGMMIIKIPFDLTIRFQLKNNFFFNLQF
jgi:hypothetical protein